MTVAGRILVSTRKGLFSFTRSAAGWGHERTSFIG